MNDPVEFIKISDSATIKIKEIRKIEIGNTGYIKDTEGWIIKFFTGESDDYNYVGFGTKEERDKVYNNLNNFLGAIPLKEI